MPQIKKSCYWCGKPAASKAHVPPLNLYPNNKRVALLTVPVCQEHCEAFALLDEKMRHSIQAACHSAFAPAVFDVKPAPALEDPQAVGLVKKLFQSIRQIASPMGLTKAAQFEHDDCKLYLEKIARGLHYKHFKSPIGGEFAFAIKQSFSTTPRMLDFFKRLSPHFSNRDAVKVPRVSYPEIFQYRYIKGQHGKTSMFAVAMRFYSDLEAITIFTSDGVTE